MGFSRVGSRLPKNHWSEETEQVEGKIQKMRQCLQELLVVKAQLETLPDRQLAQTDPDARAMTICGAKGTAMLGCIVQTAVDTNLRFSAGRCTAVEKQGENCSFVLFVNAPLKNNAQRGTPNIFGVRLCCKGRFVERQWSIPRKHHEHSSTDAG